ncbi:MAG: small basic family protein [Firmicutes bacterium]|nr:small basic family protein [Alicyclobacillaceae bacterium]MCL6497779.1 small basic family protein [Bacillota bacterium]
MWIVVLALIVGILAGLHFPLVVPASLAHYLSIALLAVLDTVFGGLRAHLEHRFDPLTFITGLISNAVLAALLTYFGDKLGVPLYDAALFAFGFRIFQNLGAIRHLLLVRWVRHREKLHQLPG